MFRSHPTARQVRPRSVTSVLAVALAALVLASCGADDAPTDDAAAPAAASDDEAAGQDDAAQDDAGQDAASDGEPDEGAGGSGYVHPVSTDLPLPTEHCELAAHVHGQRQNGSTLVGPIGTYHHDGVVDMDPVPYGLLHYENVIAGIEALDDPDLATALEHVSSFHAGISEILDSGVQGEELAVELADFHYGTDPAQSGEGGDLLRNFEQAWLEWLDAQGC